MSTDPPSPPPNGHSNPSPNGDDDGGNPDVSPEASSKERDETSETGLTSKATGPVGVPVRTEPRSAFQRIVRSHWLGLMAAAVLLLSVLGPLALPGLWDPPELFGAEISRRIAVHAFGAKDLVVEGGNNTLPSIEEVGRGELPYFLSALGFRVFGLHDWAGRIPLALVALFGALGLYGVCRHFSGPRLAAFATLTLATTPLFFSQSRAIFGDAVTAGLSALAFALLLYSTAPRGSLWLRLSAFVLGAGAAFAGIPARGVWIGVCIPALSVGLSWWFAGATENGRRRFDSAALFGLLSLTIGLAALVWGSVALHQATASDYWRALGSAVAPPSHSATHDFIVHHLGHALFPFSAFVPVAIGLTLARPARADRERGEQQLRFAVLCCASLAVGAHTLIAPRVGLVPFSASYALAAIVAFGLVELDRRRTGVPAVAMCTAAFAIVLFSDFRHFPEKSLSVFALEKATIPENFANATKLSFALAAAPLVLSMALLSVERWSFIRAAIDRFSGTFFRHFRSRTALFGMMASGLVLSFGYYPALASHVSPVGVFETFRELAKPGEALATTGKGGNASAYYGTGDQKHFEHDRAALDWLMGSESERRWLVVRGNDLPRLTSSYRNKVPGKTLPVLDATSGDVLLVSNRLASGETNKNPLLRYLPESEPKPARPVRAEFGDSLRVIGWEMRDPSSGELVEALKAGQSYRIHLYYEVLGRITKNWETFVHIDGNSSRVNGDHKTLEDEYPLRYWNKGDFIADQHVFELEPDVVPGEYTVYFGFFSGKSRLDVTLGGDKDDRVDGGKIQVR